MAQPQINVAYDHYITLISGADTSEFIADPTIEAGDIQVSVGGAAYVDLTTLPVVDPAGSVSVKVSLSADEMSASKVQVLAIDQSGEEWKMSHTFIDVLEVTEVVFNSLLIIIEEAGQLPP